MLKIAFDKSYKLALEKSHRFPMIKYELIPEQLVRKNICNESNFFSPLEITKTDAILTHDEKYYDQLVCLSLSKTDRRQIGFPLTKELIKRERIIAQGTIQNTYYALKYGISMNIAGGTHHAFKNKPGAFCMLNDQAIGARFLLNNGLVKKILIVDLDVHQGNGTAEIFNNDSAVFTFSMHGKNNYPFKKEQSDLDIELDNNVGDSEYLSILKKMLPQLIEKEQPDFIYYLSGVDVIATDKLGKLSLTIEGCKQRDQFVLDICKSQNIPVMCSMGGGYSPDIKVIVGAHANTYRLAQDIFF